MITNVSKIISPDLFVENETLLFERQRALQYGSVVPSLSAITFVARKTKMAYDLGELAIACGHEATALIDKKTHESLGFWLFVAEKFEPPSAKEGRIREHHIAQYRNIWREGLHRIVPTPIVSSDGEIVIETAAFVIIAGLLDVHCSIPEAINAVRTHPAYLILVSERSILDSPDGVRSIFISSFPQEADVEQLRVNWLSLAVAFCPRGDLLLRVSGLFDDHEAAVDIIGTSERILSL